VTRPVCWLCLLDRVRTDLDAASRCPVHGLVRDRVLGFVQVDVRLLAKGEK
jgi:hypothetical protein